jgi:hypothetical protein
MPIVAVNARKELSEFYPPPYNFLGPTLRIQQKRRGMGQQQSASAAATNAGIATAITDIGGVLTGILLGVFKGCGASCSLTSTEANQIEQELQENVNAYFASPRTLADQQAALQNFDNAWAQLVQYCGSPSFGQAGANCIDDRQSGACTWKTSGCSLSTGTPPVWSCGAAGSGDQCWNWFVGYRDPIANDTMPAQQAAAQAQAAASGSAPSSSAPAASSTSGLSVAGISLSSLPTWLIPALLVGGGILIFARGD